MSVAEVAEQHATQRAREKADSESSEGSELRYERRHGRRKEQRRKYKRCRGSVKEEVVPLDAGTNQRREGDAAQFTRRLNRS
jgi:hypothetical protein